MICLLNRGKQLLLLACRHAGCSIVRLGPGFKVGAYGKTHRLVKNCNISVTTFSQRPQAVCFAISTGISKGEDNQTITSGHPMHSLHRNNTLCHHLCVTMRCMWVQGGRVVQCATKDDIPKPVQTHVSARHAAAN